MCDLCLFTASLSPNLPPPDSGQYNNLLPGMTKHQVHSNAFVLLSEYGQSDCGFSIWRCPSIFMDVVMCEHRTLDSEIFRCVKFTTLTLLSLLISCNFPFPIVGLKVSSLPTLTLKYPKNCHTIFREFIEHTVQLFFEAILHINQNNNRTPATSQYYV
jgi:hypothetical protein